MHSETPPCCCLKFTLATSYFTLFFCCAVTTKTKIISQKPSLPSLPRVQESQDLLAHWTNRYNRQYTHRWLTFTWKRTIHFHTEGSPDAAHFCIRLIKPINKQVCVSVSVRMCVLQGDKMPALELSSPCRPSPLPSPHLSPSYYRSSVPHPVPYLAAQTDR